MRSTRGEQRRQQVEGTRHWGTTERQCCKNTSQHLLSRFVVKINTQYLGVGPISLPHSGFFTGTVRLSKAHT